MRSSTFPIWQVKQLSGGQRQRLVLAAAFWSKPHLIALDEPTNYLDNDTLAALTQERCRDMRRDVYRDVSRDMYAKIYAVICAEMARVLAHPTSQPAERHSLIIDGAFFALQRLDLNAALLHRR